MTTPTSAEPIQRYNIGYPSDDWGQRSSTPSGIPDASGSWVRYADHVAALAAKQATAAQAVTFPAQSPHGSLIPAQPAAHQPQQGVAYAALPDERAAFESWQTDVLGRSLDELSKGADRPDEYDDVDVHNEWTAWQARASHGQAPAQPNCRTCNDHGAVGSILTAEPCPDCTPSPQAAQQAPAGASALNGQLYAALGNLFSHLGAEGCVCADHPFVRDAMTALKRIDGGVYLDDLAVPIEPDAHRDDLLKTVQLLEDGEWAEHFAETPLGMRLEDQITKLHCEISTTPSAQQANSWKWIERWYGSGGKEGYEGWSIVSKEGRSLVAYLGRGVEPDAVAEIVMAHNAAPAAPSTPASGGAKQANICTDCYNADSWGLPDRPCCGSCRGGSNWQPLNASSVNPHLPASPTIEGESK